MCGCVSMKKQSAMSFILGHGRDHGPLRSTPQLGSNTNSEHFIHYTRLRVCFFFLFILLLSAGGRANHLTLGIHIIPNNLGIYRYRWIDRYVSSMVRLQRQRKRKRKRMKKRRRRKEKGRKKMRERKVEANPGSYTCSRHLFLSIFTFRFFFFLPSSTLVVLDTAGQVIRHRNTTVVVQN